MSSGNYSNPRTESAKSFVDYCTDKFGWSDLSKDTVMDVGCGVAGFCGAAVLDKFPNVGVIFGIDNNPKIVHNFRPKHSRMGCQLADIERRETLQKYEGQITKVFSTHLFPLLKEKNEAFQNLFYILKPGGEAAVLFAVKDFTDDWATEMLKVPKWEKALEGRHGENRPKKGAADYQKMVEDIGFQVIACEERRMVIHNLNRRRCADTLLIMYEEIFNLTSDAMIKEFKEEGLQVLLKLSESYTEDRLTLCQTELHLLLRKPT